MKAFLSLLILFIVFSCKTNYYLNDPIKSIPNLGLQASLKSNGILIATDSNLKMDTAYMEKCLESLRGYIETKSEIKIMEKIYFRKKPNVAILTELKTKYKVDGLLLLTNLNVQKDGVDVPSGKFEYRDNRMPEPYFQVTKHAITWTNVYVKTTSDWEYYDFTTGKSYVFSTKYEDVIKPGQHISDLDSYVEQHFQLLDPLFYQNGIITGAHLTGELNTNH